MNCGGHMAPRDPTGDPEVWDLSGHTGSGHTTTGCGAMTPRDVAMWRPREPRRPKGSHDPMGCGVALGCRRLWAPGTSWAPPAPWVEAAPGVPAHLVDGGDPIVRCDAVGCGDRMGWCSGRMDSMPCGEVLPSVAASPCSAAVHWLRRSGCSMVSVGPLAPCAGSPHPPTYATLRSRTIFDPPPWVAQFCRHRPKFGTFGHVRADFRPALVEIRPRFTNFGPILVDSDPNLCTLADLGPDLVELGAKFGRFWPTFGR